MLIETSLFWGVKNNRAEKSPNWKGGISSVYYRRISDYSKPCSVCNTLDKKREVHHIDKNRKNNNPNNLMIVCTKCHEYFHLRILETWAKKYNQCINCNTTEKRHWIKGLCKKCYDEDKRINHRTKYLQQKKDYRQRKKEKIKITGKVYYILNKERIKKYQKEYYQKRKEGLLNAA